MAISLVLSYIIDLSKVRLLSFWGNSINMIATKERGRTTSSYKPKGNRTRNFNAQMFPKTQPKRNFQPRRSPRPTLEKSSKLSSFSMPKSLTKDANYLSPFPLSLSEKRFDQTGSFLLACNSQWKMTMAHSNRLNRLSDRLENYKLLLLEGTSWIWSQLMIEAKNMNHGSAKSSYIIG